MNIQHSFDFKKRIFDRAANLIIFGSLCFATGWITASLVDTAKFPIKEEAVYQIKTSLIKER